MTKPRQAHVHAHPHPREKPHHPHAPLAALLFAAVFVLGLLSVHETGTWLHIKTGALIVSGHAVPSEDPFSYTAAGQPWTTDSWLADVLFFALHRGLGPAGLSALKSAAAAAGFALLLPVNPATPVLAASVLGLGAAAAWPGLTEMPAVFDFLLLALMIRALRPRRRFQWRTVFSVAAIELLWANLHGLTAVLGLWLVALKVFKTSLRTSSRERLMHGALFAAAAAALLCNPHGLSVIGHIFTGLEESSTAWRPLYPWLSGWAFFAAAGTAACALYLQEEFFLTMTTASLIVLSLMVPQMRSLCVMACCPTITLGLGHVLPRIDDKAKPVSVWAAGMAAVVVLYWALVTWPLASARGYGVAGVGPALDFIKTGKISGRLFNEAGIGAALIGRGEAPVFVDERAALYGPSFMKDAADWPQAFPRLDGVYHFDYAVLLNRRRGYPARVLDDDPDWALAYADDDALVYVNRKGVDARLAGKPGLLHPNDPDLEKLDQALARDRAGVLRELDDWMLKAPQAVQPLIWKAYALNRIAQPDEARRLVILAARNPGLWRDPELMAALESVAASVGEGFLSRRCRWRETLISLRRGD